MLYPAEYQCWVYIFNVYMPCDSTTNANLDDYYNDVLSVISQFCATHNVVNCVIGGDLNTDVSRIRSGNTISLHNYMDKENLFLAINNNNNNNNNKNLYSYSKNTNINYNSLYITR